MSDVVGRSFTVWAVGPEGLETPTIGALTVASDHLLFLIARMLDPSEVSRLEIPLGEGATATVEANVGQPAAAGFIVTVTWEGKRVRFLYLSEDDATAIARHIGIEAVPG